VLLFEGSITLVLPLWQAVESPQGRILFSRRYCWVISFIVAFYAAFAITCWSAFGSNVGVVLTTSLPPGRAATSVQLAYGVAVVLTFPLQLFPANEVVDGLASTRCAGSNPDRDGSRHGLAASIVMVVALACAALVCMDSLAPVVALMGGLLGCPMAFCGPPLIHSALVRSGILKSPRVGFVLCLDWLVVCFGITAATFSTVTTVAHLLPGSDGR
jgi:proton-coupled amino acid transporter